MPKREPSGARPKGVFVVHLNDKTSELTTPGIRIQLTPAWLRQYATVDGEGVLDSYVLASKGPYVTAYFDQDGAGKAAPSCLLFPEGGESIALAGGIALAGPVVIACFGAESQTEATVQASQFLSVVKPEKGAPYVHPIWPTIQALLLSLLVGCGAVESVLNTEKICDLHCGHAKCELDEDKWVCPD
jgi:hypothetical protein